MVIGIYRVFQKSMQTKLNYSRWPILNFVHSLTKVSKTDLCTFVTNVIPGLIVRNNVGTELSLLLLFFIFFKHQKVLPFLVKTRDFCKNAKHVLIENLLKDENQMTFLS
uniref:Uncharacterized protein n=1 Tax=Cacopsylla melanoneura TaxID=428564 RepID=A0A8D9A7C5_9HEMI